MTFNIDITGLDFKVALRREDIPTGPKPTCPPFCTEHFDDSAGGPGYCYSTTRDGLGLSYDRHDGAIIQIHELPNGDTLTPEQARQFAAALMAEADRAEQARALFSWPR